jgi:hypothetical protein
MTTRCSCLPRPGVERKTRNPSSQAKLADRNAVPWLHANLRPIASAPFWDPLRGRSAFPEAGRLTRAQSGAMVPVTVTCRCAV